MSSQPKVVVIGLDGATFKLIKPLVEEGRMPNFKKIIEKGSHGVLRSTIPPLTGPSWASFATGKQPGKHGVFDFLLPNESLADFRIASSKDIAAKTIYEMMVDENREPITVNLPTTWPPRTTNTICITSLLTQGDQFIYPKGLEEEVPELKNYRLTPNEELRVKGQDDAYILDVLKLEEERWEAVKKLYLTRPWDFFFFLFSGTDWISHRKYREMYEERDETALKIFSYCDQAIGWVMDHLPDDTNLLIVSDHGFLVHDKIFYFNKWLEQEGYVKTKMGSKDFANKATARGVEMDRIRGKKKTIRLGKKVFDIVGKNPAIYKAAKWGYHNVLKRLPITLKMDMGLDYENTKACLPRGSYMTNIYINDVMRYKNGCVQTQEEVDALKEELMEKIGALQYEGVPIVKRVMGPEEVYGDQKPLKSPDIFFELDEFWLDGHFSAPGIVEKAPINKHSMEGIFLAYGPDIDPGKEINGAQIADLAPTILHLMGMDIPSDMDGKLLNTIFTQNSEALARQPKYRSAETEKDRINKALESLTI